jgi:hypothetical protein
MEKYNGDFFEAAATAAAAAAHLLPFLMNWSFFETFRQEPQIPQKTTPGPRLPLRAVGFLPQVHCPGHRRLPIRCTI